MTPDLQLSFTVYIFTLRISDCMLLSYIPTGTRVKGTHGCWYTDLSSVHHVWFR